MKRKRILVTGGAGFLGINLIRFLLSRVKLIKSLDMSPFDYPEHDMIEIVEGDIRDENAVNRAMQDIDIVIHCAAALPLYSKKEIFDTDVRGTRNILESAKNHNVERVIFISSTAVYGMPDHCPIKEDSALVGIGYYGKAKIEAEKVCKEYRKKGVCISILRPKSFIGPERLGVFAILYEWASEGRNFPMIGSGDNRYQLLDVEDLCEAIYLCCIKNKIVVNDTYNVGARKFATFKEDLQSVLNEASFGKKILSFPKGPIILILKALEKLKLSPLYEWVYKTAGKDSYVSTEKIERRLGWKPKFSNRDALIRNYRWYLDNKEGFKNQSGVSHRVPWKQGVLKVVKKFF